MLELSHLRDSCMGPFFRHVNPALVPHSPEFFVALDANARTSPRGGGATQKTSAKKGSSGSSITILSVSFCAVFGCIFVMHAFVMFFYQVSSSTGTLDFVVVETAEGATACVEYLRV